MTKTDNKTIETWDSVADLYQTNFMDLDLYNDTYDAFCSRVEEPGARILEIACGPGNITRYLLRKRPDFEILATDAAPNMVALAKRNNPGARCEVLDCRSMDLLTTKWDGIVCGFCLPYLSRTETAKLLRDCSERLKSGGILYLSAIEGDYKRSGFQMSSDGRTRMFVYFHEADDLFEGLRTSGFTDVELIRKPYPQKDRTVSTHLIMLAKKE